MGPEVLSAPREGVIQRLDEIDRLLADPANGGAGLLSRPVVFVVGRTGTTKTSVLSSDAVGGAPAGQDPRTRGVSEGADAWTVGTVVLLELAGSVFEDENAWRAAFEWFRPSRFRSRVLGLSSPPRKMLACVSSLDLLKLGDADLADRAATLAQRMAEAARASDGALSLTVLFTKLDSIADFDAFATVLAPDDAQSIVGADLDPTAMGEGRWDEAVAIVCRTLGALRTRAIAEYDSAADGRRAFNFAREFGKASDALGDFLKTLGTAMAQSGGGALEGFHFTGVRPVTLREAAAKERARSAGATDFFVPAPELPRDSAGPIRVPDWVFLRTLFDRRVEAARSRSAGPSPVKRRVGWGVSAFLGLVALGLLASFVGNRALSRSLEGRLTPLKVDGALSVANLEGLRLELERLQGYGNGGRPLRLGFGLYDEDLLGEVLPAYFAGFARAVATPLVNGLAESLSLIGSSRDLTYGDAFEGLRAYMVLTAYPDSADERIAGVMRGGLPTGVEGVRSGLFERQLSFYATLPTLRGGGVGSMDDGVVVPARRFLTSFDRLEAYHYGVVHRVLSSVPDVSFAGSAEGSRVQVWAPHVVPGAFSALGWESVSRQLDDPMRALAGDAWVSGRTVPTQGELSGIQRTIRDRYLREFSDEWIQVIASARFTGVNGATDGSRAQTGLFEFFAHVLSNTTIGATEVESIFDALRRVVSISDGGEVEPASAARPYVDALGGLDRARANDAREEREAAAAAARGALDALAANFPAAGRAGEVSALVRALLEQPIAQALQGG
jgi:type VI protein secretion system component VasK